MNSSVNLINIWEEEKKQHSKNGTVFVKELNIITNDTFVCQNILNSDIHIILAIFYYASVRKLKYTHNIF